MDGGWRQLLLPHIPLLSSPCLGTSFAAPSGTLGQLEDRATHHVRGCGSLELFPQCPVISARLFRPQLCLELLVEATNFKLIQFL